MKKIRLYKNLTAVFLLGAITCMGLFSCEEHPNAYKSTDGVPEVLYVRTTDPLKADSLLDGAFMGNIICIVGNNLRSIQELYFNDQQALLNTSYITDHTIIVTVPNDIPVDVTDKMYLKAVNGEVVEYPFKTKVPAPSVMSISCEYAPEGSEAILYGDYFIDDPNKPLKIEMAGNLPVTQILSIEKTQVKFIVPKGAMKGYINVTSLYGTSRSKFQYKDDRGMILDFDKLMPVGWRAGRMKSEGGITGTYGFFKGDMEDGKWFDGDANEGFELDVWSRSPQGPFTNGDWFDASASSLDKLLVKFEANVLQPWSSSALQIIFQPWSTYGNGHFGKADLSRGLWNPWKDTGSFVSNGWFTVTIPMTEFKFDADGKPIDRVGPGNYGGLTLFVWKGGVPGKKCTTEIWIDNFRVVPVDK